MKITDIKKTDNYIKIRLVTDRGESLYDVQMWCAKTQCGKRVTVHHFAFKTEAEYAMFLLRWAPTNEISQWTKLTRRDMQ